MRVVKHFAIEKTHVRFELSKFEKFLQEAQAFFASDFDHRDRLWQLGRVDGDEKRTGED